MVGLLEISPSILIENQIIDNLINYAYNEVSKRFIDISNKIEQGTRDAYLNIVEKAYIQTSEGITYQEAIRNALLELGEKGITTLTYKTVDDNGNIKGLRSYDIEGAVRRELITATHNLTNNINKSIAEELQVEFLYLSEHLECRPQHFPWQGTIIKRVDLVKITRLGEVDGMGGPNCKHYPTPYFGAARGKELKKISLEEATEQYKLSQKQRYLERGIRKWKRRERIFKTAEDKEYYKKCKTKVKEWQLRNKAFTEDNNLKRYFSRENVEKVTNNNKDDIIAPNFIRKNAKENYDSTIEEQNINNAINIMPDKLKQELKNTEFEIITIGKTDKNYSRYDRKNNKFYIYEGADKEEIIHEIGHYVETKYNILNDEKYKEIRNKGLENCSIYEVRELINYSGIKGIKNAKFISEQQGRIYMKDLDGKSYIGYNQKINLNCLGEYFAEAFREYWINRENLKKHDLDLFNYIEEVLKNDK